MKKSDDKNVVFPSKNDPKSIPKHEPNEACHKNRSTKRYPEHFVGPQVDFGSILGPQPAPKIDQKWDKRGLQKMTKKRTCDGTATTTESEAQGAILLSIHLISTTLSISLCLFGLARAAISRVGLGGNPSTPAGDCV